MKIKIDKEAGAAYIYLFTDENQDEENLRSEPIDENIVLDYTQDGKLFGIEVLALEILDLEKINIDNT